MESSILLGIKVPEELRLLVYDKEFIRHALSGYVVEHCVNYISNCWELILRRRYRNNIIGTVYLYVRMEEQDDGWIVAEKSWSD